MNNYIFCISAKDPDPEHLFKNISLLNKHYNKPEIHIIDSKSEQTLGYNSIKEFDNVKTHYADNVNYELGAWKYAVDNIPAENYICIQDTVFLEKKIEFNFIDNDVYYLKHYWGWHSCFEVDYFIDLYEEAIKFLTKNTVYYKKCWDSWIKRNQKFNLVTHTSFGIKSHILKEVFSNLNNLPIKKIHSCATERLMYWIFHHHTDKCVPLEHVMVDFENGVWDKKHGGRQ